MKKNILKNMFFDLLFILLSYPTEWLTNVLIKINKARKLDKPQ